MGDYAIQQRHPFVLTEAAVLNNNPRGLVGGPPRHPQVVAGGTCPLCQVEPGHPTASAFRPEAGCTWRKAEAGSTRFQLIQLGPVAV